MCGFIEMNLSVVISGLSNAVVVWSVKKMFVGTVSKALQKSRRRMSVWLWSFMEEAQSWTASKESPA